MNQRIDISESELADFCVSHGIARLSLFGSRLRDAARPNSDIDLLVEFEVGRTPGFLALSAMEAELSSKLGGIPVDLRTKADLSRYFRDAVIASAEVQYARR